MIISTEIALSSEYEVEIDWIFSNTINIANFKEWWFNFIEREIC